MDMDKQLAIPWQPSLAQLFLTQIALNSRIKAMQSESATWHDEHRKWKKDIVGWQNMQRRIEAVLYQLERELPDFRDVAAHLSGVIGDHEARLREHEELVAGYLMHKQADNSKWSELDAEHKRQAGLHAEVQDEHDAFRAEYFAAMTKVERLVKRLQAVCH